MIQGHLKPTPPRKHLIPDRLLHAAQAQMGLRAHPKGGAESPLQMPAGNAHFASQRLNPEISVPVVKLRIRPIKPTIRLAVLLELPEQEPSQQFRPDLLITGLPNPVSNCLDVRSPQLTHVDA